jgi:LysR family transcriptional regulator (chromosome initiation inhibitor)
MLDYPSLAAVEAVVREGSFERGAIALGITPSAISQRVRGLEERLGAILIVRSQPCQPTELGRKLCAHLDRVRILEHDLAPVLGDVGAAAAPVSLRIAVNADSLATWFVDAIEAFKEIPDVSLRLTVADEKLTTERLLTGEVLAAVTSDATPVQGCKTAKLGALRYLACASADFVRRHFPKGLNATMLSKAPHLRFDGHDRLQQRWAVKAFETDLTGPAHFVPSPHGFVNLALSGVAWGMQPLHLVKDHLSSGRLVQLDPQRPLDVELYWTVARLPSGPLRRLSDAVRTAARDNLINGGGLPVHDQV